MNALQWLVTLLSIVFWVAFVWAVRRDEKNKDRKAIEKMKNAWNIPRKIWNERIGE